jgi:hypothetical protein
MFILEAVLALTGGSSLCQLQTLDFSFLCFRPDNKTLNFSPAALPKVDNFLNNTSEYIVQNMRSATEAAELRE